MEKTLDECQIGDKVKIWCYGFRNWDTDIVEVIKKGILTVVKYESGKTRQFYSDAKVLLVK